VWLVLGMLLAVIVLLLVQLSRPAISRQPTRATAAAQVLALAIFAITAVVRLRPDAALLLGLLAASAGLIVAIDPPPSGIAGLGGSRLRRAAAVVVLGSTLGCVARTEAAWGSPLDWLKDRGNDFF